MDYHAEPLPDRPARQGMARGVTDGPGALEEIPLDFLAAVTAMLLERERVDAKLERLLNEARARLGRGAVEPPHSNPGKDGTSRSQPSFFSRRTAIIWTSTFHRTSPRNRPTFASRLAMAIREWWRRLSRHDCFPTPARTGSSCRSSRPLVWAQRCSTL